MHCLRQNRQTVGFGFLRLSKISDIMYGVLHRVSGCFFAHLHPTPGKKTEEKEGGEGAALSFQWSGVETGQDQEQWRIKDPQKHSTVLWGLRRLPCCQASHTQTSPTPSQHAFFSLPAPSNPFFFPISCLLFPMYPCKNFSKCRHGHAPCHACHLPPSPSLPLGSLQHGGQTLPRQRHCTA